jgi:hypothetical protein
MTRTNVMASSRPQTAGTSTTRSGSSRVLRRLMILPVVLALAVAPAAPVLAASTGSTYNNSEAKKPTPNSGTSPSKATKTPAKTVSPATTSSTPATTTKPAKASTLPFTGFDLRWTVGAGLLLVGAGGSILVMQRRQRRDSGL